MSPSHPKPENDEQQIPSTAKKVARGRKPGPKPKSALLPAEVGKYRRAKADGRMVVYHIVAEPQYRIRDNDVAIRGLDLYFMTLVEIYPPPSRHRKFWPSDLKGMRIHETAKDCYWVKVGDVVEPEPTAG